MRTWDTGGIFHLRRWSSCLAPLLLLACSDASKTESPATPTPGLTTFVTRTINLEQTCTVDLDSGTIGPWPETRSDLWFEAVRQGERYLTPEYGARLAVVGAVAPGVTGCQVAPVVPNRIPLDVLTAGTYLCGYTNLGQVAEIRIDQAAPPYVPGSGVAPILKMTVTTYGPS